jgi:hypothetical protein
MFMIYLHTKFRIPSSNGSLFIAAKVKTKENVRKAAMLLLYILQNNCLIKSCIFSIAYNVHKFRNPY